MVPRFFAGCHALELEVLEAGRVGLVVPWAIDDALGVAPGIRIDVLHPDTVRQVFVLDARAEPAGVARRDRLHGRRVGIVEHDAELAVTERERPLTGGGNRASAIKHRFIAVVDVVVLKRRGMGVAKRRPVDDVLEMETVVTDGVADLLPGHRVDVRPAGVVGRLHHPGRPVPHAQHSLGADAELIDHAVELVRGADAQRHQHMIAGIAGPS